MKLTFERDSLEEDLVLMHKDKKLLIFNLKENSFDVLEHTLLPFRLQSSGSMMMDLRDWIVDRMLPTYRINADMVYVAFNEPRSREGQIDLAIRTKAASVLDPYWIKLKTEDVQYEDVNLFNIEWNRDIPKTLVRRDSCIRDNKSPSPELTLGGSWAKCLIREQKNSILGPIFGEIKLYKVSCKKDLKDIESEAVVSKILNSLNIQNVNYSLEELIDIPCSVCKLQTTDNKHWVSAGDLLDHSECSNLVDLGLKYGGDRFIEMLLFDYIIGNNNRRSDNWSFEYNDENEIIGMAPIYDFNESFQDEYKEYDVLNIGRRHEEVLIELMRKYNMSSFPKQVKEVICDIEISEKHRNYNLSRIEMLMSKYNGV